MGVASKKPAITVGFDQLAPLLGKPANDRTVKAVLASSGRLSNQDSGNERYVTCKAAGFELLIRAQRVHTIFTYSDGIRGHRGFSFPFGITAGPRKAVLELLGAPSGCWVMGDTAIPFTSHRADRLWVNGASNRDAWHVDGFEVVVMSAPPVGDRARNPQRRAVVIAVEISRPGD